MAKILFLSHRVPYPPNKGEKIRAYHIVRHLAERHEVWLGAFADSEEERLHREVFKAQCKEVCFIRRRRLNGAYGMMRAAATGGALSVAAFSSARMRRWCEAALDTFRPDFIYIYSSAMAQYVLGARTRSAPIIVDFVDVDSEKFRQYAEARSWPMRALYAREARALLAFDRRAAEIAKACLFISRSEGDLFARGAPESAAKIAIVPNGVDHSYFDPSVCAPAPGGRSATILFTGRMDYPPNVDAVGWFARSVFPLVRQKVPEAGFKIVGAASAAAVKALAAEPGIEVTGAVDDMRPYYCEACVAVAPLRIARGIQNKVLEAMAMARPTVVTPAALEGLSAKDGEHVLVASSQEEFARAVVSVLEGQAPANIGARARAHVVADYGWTGHLRKLDDFLSSAS